MRYQIDMERSRRAFVECQISGEFETYKALAESLGMSRSTVGRFFFDGGTSLATTQKILRAIHLEFNDVVTPVTDTTSNSFRLDECDDRAS